MSDIYAVIEKEQQRQGGVPEDSFDKAAWAEQKQADRDAVYEKIDLMAYAVNNDPKALDGCLDVMARFPNHSASNALLIFDQRPDATRIGDSKFWSEKGGKINKGERGMSILVPGNQYTRDDGSIGTFYEVKKVFDESQTSARKLLPRRYEMKNVIDSTAKAAPVSIQPLDDLQGEPAVYDHDSKTILLQIGLTPDQAVRALFTEYAHAEFAQGKQSYDRDANFGKAELAATLLAKRYGMEAKVDGQATKLMPPDAEPKDIKASLNEICNASKEVGKRMNKELDKLKERDQGMER